MSDYVTINFKFKVTKTFEIETTGYDRDQAWWYALNDSDQTRYQDGADANVEIIEEEIIKGERRKNENI